MASALTEEFAADLLPAGSNIDLIAESRHDDMLATMRGWIQSSSQHANVDGMSRQCGQCQGSDYPVSAKDSPVSENNQEIEMVDQPFAASEIGESMDADLLPELSGETWVASALTEEFAADLLPAGSNIDLIAECRHDDMLATMRGWIQSSSTPTWADCAGLSPELRCWRLQIGNLSIDTDGRLW